MSDKPDIAMTDSEWKIVRDILRRCLPHQSVWAFGSRARHTHKPFSDLDIAVISDQPIALSKMAELKEAFSESDLPWKVDIVDWASVGNSFRQLIETHKVSLQ